eukprot:TRINITY_DN13504_c0_g5_i1.p1 TRINITY_DN13504_c0_g5~~TRINITY_DN13504_c0_g5_i1.p1  ORF type:complete len:1093 (+),score=331.28 TRINITY_DN13504_c0_g5_i1:298-3576(+)
MGGGGRDSLPSAMSAFPPTLEALEHDTARYLFAAPRVVKVGTAGMGKDRALLVTDRWVYVLSAPVLEVKRCLDVSRVASVTYQEREAKKDKGGATCKRVLLSVSGDRDLLLAFPEAEGDPGGELVETLRMLRAAQAGRKEGTRWEGVVKEHAKVSLRHLAKLDRGKVDPALAEAERQERLRLTDFLAIYSSRAESHDAEAQPLHDPREQRAPTSPAPRSRRKSDFRDRIRKLSLWSRGSAQGAASLRDSPKQGEAAAQGPRKRSLQHAGFSDALSPRGGLRNVPYCTSFDWHDDPPPVMPGAQVHPRSARVARDSLSYSRDTLAMPSGWSPVLTCNSPTRSAAERSGRSCWNPPSAGYRGLAAGDRHEAPGSFEERLAIAVEQVHQAESAKAQLAQKFKALQSVNGWAERMLKAKQSEIDDLLIRLAAAEARSPDDVDSDGNGAASPLRRKSQGTPPLPRRASLGEGAGKGGTDSGRRKSGDDAATNQAVEAVGKDVAALNAAVKELLRERDRDQAALGEMRGVLDEVRAAVAQQRGGRERERGPGVASRDGESTWVVSAASEGNTSNAGDAPYPHHTQRRRWHSPLKGLTSNTHCLTPAYSGLTSVNSPSEPSIAPPPTPGGSEQRLPSPQSAAGSESPARSLPAAGAPKHGSPPLPNLRGSARSSGELAMENATFVSSRGGAFDSSIDIIKKFTRCASDEHSYYRCLPADASSPAAADPPPPPPPPDASPVSCTLSDGETHPLGGTASRKGSTPRKQHLLSPKSSWRKGRAASALTDAAHYDVSPISSVYAVEYPREGAASEGARTNRADSTASSPTPCQRDSLGKESASARDSRDGSFGHGTLGEIRQVSSVLRRSSVGSKHTAAGEHTPPRSGGGADLHAQQGAPCECAASQAAHLPRGGSMQLSDLASTAKASSFDSDFGPSRASSHLATPPPAGLVGTAVPLPPAAKPRPLPKAPSPASPGCAWASPPPAAKFEQQVAGMGLAGAALQNALAARALSPAGAGDADAPPEERFAAALRRLGVPAAGLAAAGVRKAAHLRHITVDDLVAPPCALPPDMAARVLAAFPHTHDAPGRVESLLAACCVGQK